MAETNSNTPNDEPKYPESVNTKDSDDKLIVTLVIPNMKVEKKFYFFGAAKEKPGESRVDVKIETTSLDVKVNTIHEGRTTKYRYNVKKLPGEIDKAKSSYELDTDIVKVTLVKQAEASWKSLLDGGLL